MSHIMIFLRAAYCAVRFIFRLALLFFSAPFFVSLFLFCPAAKIKQFSNIWWKLVPAFVVHKHFFVASSALHTFRLSSSGHKAGLQKGFVALYKALQLVFRLPLCSLSLSPSLLILFFNTVQSNSRRGARWIRPWEIVMLLLLLPIVMQIARQFGWVTRPSKDGQQEIRPPIVGPPPTTHTLLALISLCSPNICNVQCGEQREWSSQAGHVVLIS